MPAVMRLGLAHQPHRHQAVERARVTAAPGSIVETGGRDGRCNKIRSEEHTSELQSRLHLVCRLLLEKKKPTDDAQATRRRVCLISAALTSPPKDISPACPTNRTTPARRRTSLSPDLRGPSPHFPSPT